MQEERINSLVPSAEGRGTGAPGVYCVRMHINFLENRITNGISVTLSSVRQPISLLCGRYLPPTTLCERLQGSNESTQLFAYKSPECVSA